MNEFATALYSHQAACVEKIGRLRVGALFMEMGTGKTRTGLELAMARIAKRKARHIVWFCPVSTMKNLEEDITKHLPGVTIHVFNSRTKAGAIPNATIHIVGIEGLSSSLRVLSACEELAPGSFMILDESHLIKNPAANRSKRIAALGRMAGYRLILTGTVITQGAEDLYQQMLFLSEKILGYSHFREFAYYHLQYFRSGESTCLKSPPIWPKP